MIVESDVKPKSNKQTNEYPEQPAYQCNLSETVFVRTFYSFHYKTDNEHRYQTTCTYRLIRTFLHIYGVMARFVLFRPLLYFIVVLIILCVTLWYFTYEVVNLFVDRTWFGDALEQAVRIETGLSCAMAFPLLLFFLCS